MQKIVLIGLLIAMGVMALFHFTNLKYTKKRNDAMIYISVIDAGVVHDVAVSPYATVDEVLQKVAIKSDIDETKLNRKRIVADRDVITIPIKELEIAISINQGTVAELTQLKGVGPAMAKRIVAYRDAKGFFQSLDALKNVKGMGDKTFDKLKNHICL